MTRRAASPYFSRTTSWMAAGPPCALLMISSNVSRQLDESDEKKGRTSAAAAAVGHRARRGERLRQLRGLRGGVGVERVVCPPSLTPVADEPRLLERLQVEGEARLSGVERVGEVAHALLAPPEPVEDAEARG